MEVVPAPGGPRSPCPANVLRFSCGRKTEGDEGARPLRSLREFVLVNQNTAHIVVFRRDDQGWRYGVAEAGETLAFDSVGVEIAVDEVYRNALEAS